MILTFLFAGLKNTFKLFFDDIINVNCILDLKLLHIPNQLNH